MNIEYDTSNLSEVISYKTDHFMVLLSKSLNEFLGYSRFHNFIVG